MERLRGIDAALLYMETATSPTHTLKVAVFDPPAGDGGNGPALSLAGVKQQLSERLPRLPGFRRRIVEVPLGFHHPVWVEDAAFDLDFHLHRQTVAPPGERRQLDAAVSEIAARPLDRSRPLWELWVLDGLAGGRIAAVAKIHHAMADGVASAQLFAAVMGHGPDARAGDDDWAPEPIPSDWQLVRDAAVDRLRLLRRLPRLIRRTLSGLLAVTARLRAETQRPPLPFRDAPTTRFNSSLTPARAFATTEFSLEDVKRVKATFGATVNDVLLALVGGSVRRYLADRGELPERPLVVEVPVGTDRGAPRLSGNHTSNLFAWLRTDLADPVERLEATSAATRTAKEFHGLFGGEMYEEWSAYAPPNFLRWVFRIFARLRLANRSRPVVNLIVSSVPGPRETLYWDGAPLCALYSVGPILEGIGLNITLWSYGERVFASALACPERVDRLDEIAGGLGAELERLVDACGPDAYSAKSGFFQPGGACSAAGGSRRET